ncbi:hypothetical protein E4U17_001608 [Claviceps sp. LM77 group G4]|nr:hypothetical protein E4U17_001608 [Claviceps sp. LM77 group G4]KAG6044320.1 hypothetical protein E4U33_001550 [Claviceps sp. LM78 group G4]
MWTVDGTFPSKVRNSAGKAPHDKLTTMVVHLGLGAVGPLRCMLDALQIPAKPYLGPEDIMKG